LGIWLPQFPGMQERLLLTEPPEQAEGLVETIRQLSQTPPDKTVFILSESPALYLAGHPRNATRFSLVLPYLTTAYQQADMTHDLEKNKPWLIVDDQALKGLHLDDRFKNYPPETLHLPQIEAFIQRDYRPFLQAGRFQLYTRSDAVIP